MKLEARHLEVLARVVEHGGVTVAATVLGKSQPSVSRMLSFLEARVGQPLFCRGAAPLAAYGTRSRTGGEGAANCRRNQCGRRGGKELSPRKERRCASWRHAVLYGRRSFWNARGTTA